MQFISTHSKRRTKNGKTPRYQGDSTFIPLENMAKFELVASDFAREKS